MAGSRNLVGSSRPWQPGEQYEFLSSPSPQEEYRDTPNAMPVEDHTDTSFPDTTRGDRSSFDSATSYTTPTPSRAPTPSPSYPTHRFTSSTSDIDGEPAAPLLQGSGAYTSIRDGSCRVVESSSTFTQETETRGKDMENLQEGCKKDRPTSTVPSTTDNYCEALSSTFDVTNRLTLDKIFALLLFTVFAISLTLLLMYILNPDKEPLPWQAYCAIPPSSSYPPSYRAPLPYPYLNPLPESSIPTFPPDDLDSLPPAGVLLGVFSMDSALERRMLIRTTWASHPRSRNGAGAGDDGFGTSRTLVRFILGQPRKGWERRIQTEMEMYNDIIILPCPENMNSGKSYAYFSWAAENAWVPPAYANTLIPVPHFSYSTQSSPAPRPAPHDSHLAWKDYASGQPTPWVRPDFVAKVDDDAFVMLAELESRVRLEIHAKGHSPYSVTAEALNSRLPTSLGSGVDMIPTQAGTVQDPLVYWGYLVKDLFMGGELYGLSWSLVTWVSKDTTVKGLAKGAEDKQTAKWMALHPQAAQIRWASERCWIYDHARAGTV
ncbi:hypothetical protein J3R82DRAFT_763 [Butyriboletus roseoflavus]|nr:hypothetical protein J3R82DRAFT_763 [Butyriboletus roseoflavus]